MGIRDGVAAFEGVPAGTRAFLDSIVVDCAFGAGGSYPDVAVMVVVVAGHSPGHTYYGAVAFGGAQSKASEDQDHYASQCRSWAVVVAGSTGDTPCHPSAAAGAVGQTTVEPRAFRTQDMARLFERGNSRIITRDSIKIMRVPWRCRSTALKRIAF